MPQAGRRERKRCTSKLKSNSAARPLTRSQFNTDATVVASAPV